MPTSSQNNGQALCEAILAEASRVGEQALQGARQQAEALLAKAAAEAEAFRQQRLELARTEATRRKEQSRATVNFETRGLRWARVEVLLGAIRQEVQRRLAAREGFDYREAILGLAAEALSRMAGDSFLMRLPAEDNAALGPGLAEEVLRRVGPARALSLKIAYASAMNEPGVVIEDAAGRQLWDNRLEARLERMWPELRRQVALGLGMVASDSPHGGDA